MVVSPVDECPGGLGSFTQKQEPVAGETSLTGGITANA